MLKMEVDSNSSESESKELPAMMMQEDQEKRPYRVTDCERRIKKGFAASSYEHLVQQCADRFCFLGPLTLVLEEDGTEVDVEYFKLLPINTRLMILKIGQEWTATEFTQPRTGPEQSTEGRRITEMVERIKASNASNVHRTVSPTVTGNIGWLHYCYLNDKYTMVKNTKKHQNVGPRPVVLNRCSTEEQILTLLKKTFFPRGRSVQGLAANIAFSIGNVKGVEIPNIGDVLAQNKPHIYLLSRERIPDISVDTCDSDELLDPQIPGFNSRNAPRQGILPVSWNSPTTPNLAPGQQNMNARGNTMHTPGSSMQGTSWNETGTPELAPGQQNMNARGNTMRTPGSSMQGTSWNETGTPEVCFRMSNKCCICFDADINAFLDPCLHKFCEGCASKVQSAGQACPFCRTEIQNVGRLSGNMQQ